MSQVNRQQFEEVAVLEAQGAARAQPSWRLYVAEFERELNWMMKYAPATK